MTNYQESIHKSPLFDRPKVARVTLLLFLLGIAATGVAYIGGYLHTDVFPAMLDAARMVWMLFILSFAWLMVGMDLARALCGRNGA